MLSCAGFGDEAGLAHPLGQQCLPQYVVDLVSAGVVEILPLEIDLCAAEIRRDLACIVQAAGAACVIVQQGGQLRLKAGVVLVVFIRRIQLLQGIHQRFGNILSAVHPKTALFLTHF